MDVSYLLPYCVTDKQTETIIALTSSNSIREAARKLGLNKATVTGHYEKVKKRAALSGVAPEADLAYPVPEGQFVTGVSTLIDKQTGESRLQWVKTSTSQEQQLAVMREAIEALKEELPVYPVIYPVDKPRNKDLLNLYTITDYHFGCKSWREQTGADWDLSIAETLLINWFDTAIRQSPNANKAVLCQLGDFLHFDGFEPVTPQHKHILDVDSRFQKVVRTVIRVVRRIIDMLLVKYQKVHILMMEGNHDLASSIWLREWLASAYSDNPRIVVDTSSGVYSCVEHGLTSLFFHHGHRRKIDNIDDVFVGKYREVFGRTKYSYAHMGHLHNNEVKETNLMKIERHRTLAAPDAYAADGGWISGRDAKVITYSSKWGEVARLTISPEMVSK